MGGDADLTWLMEFKQHFPYPVRIALSNRVKGKSGTAPPYLTECGVLGVFPVVGTYRRGTVNHASVLEHGRHGQGKLAHCRRCEGRGAGVGAGGVTGLCAVGAVHVTKDRGRGPCMVPRPPGQRHAGVD